MKEAIQGEIGFCTFRLDNRRYAINILTVQEVNRHCGVTPAFGAPTWVRGLLNLRGQVVTVIDTGVGLGVGARETLDSSRLIILKTNAELASRGYDDLATCEDLVGLHVDAVTDVIACSESRIESPPAETFGNEMPSVCGVLQLEDDVVHILDPKVLLSFDKAAQG
jgi:purine-binding chemotaxis protein CheW